MNSQNPLESKRAEDSTIPCPFSITCDGTNANMNLNLGEQGDPKPQTPENISASMFSGAIG